MHRPQLHPITIIFTSLALSVFSPVVSDAAQWDGMEQNFLVTAYYSPLPNQDHYFLGSYEKEIEFNGRGIEGNDGTPVYAGMIAAPPEFPFGTKIAIPEYEVVGTVHDRGGRIQIAEDGITPHIDLWMGRGEEGLARALEWGARIVKGIAYAPGSENMPEESFELAKFEAPVEMLASLPENPITLQNVQDLRFGERSWEISALQHALQSLGYFDHAITTLYGDVTRDAVAFFQRDMNLKGNGEIADEKTITRLAKQLALTKEVITPWLGEEILLAGASGKSVRVLQRMLAMLDLYEGAIDGAYDQELKGIVYNFQRGRNIVGSRQDVGAGMVGPQTHRALLTAWRSHRIQKRGRSMIVVSL